MRSIAVTSATATRVRANATETSRLKMRAMISADAKVATVADAVE